MIAPASPGGLCRRWPGARGLRVPLKRMVRRPSCTCEETRLPYAAINRRALLGGAAAATLPVLLGACRPEATKSLAPLPDVSVVAAAIGQEEALIALYEAGLTAHPSLAERIEPVLAHHREHLTILREHLRPGTDGRTATPPPATAPPFAAGSPGTTASPGAPPIPQSVTRALSAFRTAERRAAAARVLDVDRVRPAVAQLLASIGACEVGHALALTGTT